MEIGTAIAVASGILGCVAVIFKMFPGKENATHCGEHSGIQISINGLEEWLNKIESKLDRVIEQGNK